MIKRITALILVSVIVSSITFTTSPTRAYGGFDEYDIYDTAYPESNPNKNENTDDDTNKKNDSTNDKNEKDDHGHDHNHGKEDEHTPWDGTNNIENHPYGNEGPKENLPGTQTATDNELKISNIDKNSEKVVFSTTLKGTKNLFVEIQGKNGLYFKKIGNFSGTFDGETYEMTLVKLKEIVKDFSQRTTLKFKINVKDSNPDINYIKIVKINTASSTSSTPEDINTPNTVENEDDKELVTIADASLKQIIKTQLRLSTDTITKSDMKKLETLVAKERGISNISGLEHAVNLSQLVLSENKITDISSLKNLTKLTRLTLNDNEIVNVDPLENLSNLVLLKLDDNKITDISKLSKLSKLSEGIHVQGNQLTNIDVMTNFKQVRILDASNNKITTIPNLDSLKSLTHLHLNINKIENVDNLKGQKNVQYLYLADNNISNIDSLANLKQLRELGVGNIDFEKHTSENIYPLNLGTNGISDLSKFADFTGMLQVANQKISIDATENNFKLALKSKNGEEISILKNEFAEIKDGNLIINKIPRNKFFVVSFFAAHNDTYKFYGKLTVNITGDFKAINKEISPNNSIEKAVNTLEISPINIDEKEFTVSTNMAGTKKLYVVDMNDTFKNEKYITTFDTLTSTIKIEELKSKLPIQKDSRLKFRIEQQTLYTGSPEFVEKIVIVEATKPTISKPINTSTNTINTMPSISNIANIDRSELEKAVVLKSDLASSGSYQECTVIANKFALNGATKIVVENGKNNLPVIKLIDDNGNSVKSHGLVEVIFPLPKNIKNSFKVKVDGVYTTFARIEGTNNIKFAVEFK